MTLIQRYQLGDVIQERGMGVADKERSAHCLSERQLKKGRDGVTGEVGGGSSREGPLISFEDFLILPRIGEHIFFFTKGSSNHLGKGLAP